jgi:hypothetical protein
LYFKDENGGSALMPGSKPRGAHAWRPQLAHRLDFEAW